MFWSFSAAIN